MFKFSNANRICTILLPSAVNRLNISGKLGGRFPRVFGDNFGEEFGDKFSDEFSESPNLVMN